MLWFSWILMPNKCKGAYVLFKVTIRLNEWVKSFIFPSIIMHSAKLQTGIQKDNKQIMIWYSEQNRIFVSLWIMLHYLHSFISCGRRLNWTLSLKNRFTFQFFRNVLDMFIKSQLSVMKKIQIFSICFLLFLLPAVFSSIFGD